MRHILPLLMVAGLLLAPTAQAQVTHGHVDQPPTQAQIDQQRADLQTRMSRLDRDYTTLERNTAALRDAERRTMAEQDLERLGQQRDALRQQWTQLETATPDTWADPYRQFTERYDAFEHGLYRARLTAAASPAEYRRTAGQRLDEQRERFTEINQRLRHMDPDHRAEAAYELIQLRNRYDDLQRTHRTMARLPQNEFTTVRRTFTDQWTAFDQDFRQAGRDMMHWDASVAAR